MPAVSAFTITSPSLATGLVLDPTGRRAFVMTRFDNGISVVDTAAKQEVAHVQLYNPEPATHGYRINHRPLAPITTPVRVSPMPTLRIPGFTSSGDPVCAATGAAGTAVTDCQEGLSTDHAVARRR